MNETHINSPRRLHVVVLICLIVITAVAGTVATLSAGINGPELAYLPILLDSRVPTSTTGTLQDGGIMTGLDGLKMGTISGTITSSLQITITRVSSTAVELGPTLTPLSDYYDIMVDRDLYTPSDHPFLIGLPIPDGVITSNLALAVLIPPQRIPDNNGGLPHWFIFRGFYEAASKLLVTSINGLSSSGYQVVLVEAPSLSPLTPIGGRRISPLAHLASFEVLCNSTYSAGQCGPAQTDKVALELSEAYDDFQDLLDFNEPHIADHYGGLHLATLMFGYHSYFNIILAPPPGSSCIVEGQYVADSNMEICVPPGSSIGPHDRQVIRHEYFHATQYGYSTILHKPKDMWVTDGTATAAERSLFTMTRSLDYPLHKVDVPITDPSDEHRYSAEDFFVYVGQKNGVGLDYLKSLFEVGAKTQDVVDVLGDGTHLPIYWDWVKNQVLEKTIDLDGALTDPCSLQAEVVNKIDPWHFDYRTIPTHTVGTLEPLNSVVVGIVWDGSYDAADGIVYPNGGSGDTEAVAALRYKFYRDGESGCKGVPDGHRFFDKADGPISPDNYFWVLISNIHPTEPHAYTVRFEVTPKPPN